jgi:hypothetical protein
MSSRKKQIRLKEQMTTRERPLKRKLIGKLLD